MQCNLVKCEKRLRFDITFTVAPEYVLLPHNRVPVTTNLCCLHVTSIGRTMNKHKTKSNEFIFDPKM